MKFRSKPVEITAEQFNGGIPDPKGVFRDPVNNLAYVVTIHDQRVYLGFGDWVIPEPDGVHYYPCKPDIFANKYEPVYEKQTVTSADVGKLEDIL